MNLLTLSSLSFGMAMDAFAVAVAKGANDKQPNLWTAIKGGVFFGVVEGLAPAMGYVIGKVAQAWVMAFDHWLAFALLVFLGVRFIYHACQAEPLDVQKPSSNNLALLFLTAIATSVDSVVVGVSLAFFEVNIYLACLLIGLATAIMATLGLYLGNRLGASFGRYAMSVGGAVLIGIGAVILYGHLIDHGFLA